MQGICFIGAGKMATAIATGLVRKNIGAPIHTYDPAEKAAEQFCRKSGGTAYPSPKEALKETGIVLLAVKPQYLTEAVNAFREEIGDRLVVSIVAGATIASLEKLTGTKRIVRVMPNTPALVGEGMSCIAATSAVQESDLAEVETLLSSASNAFPRSLHGVCRFSVVGKSKPEGVHILFGSHSSMLFDQGGISYFTYFEFNSNNKYENKIV